jgi:hypothetical protein
MRTPMHRSASLAALVASALSCACTSSHPLEKKDRAVVEAPEAVVWHEAARTDVVGYFESDRITGDAAGSLRRAFYSFAADGTFSGAALVQDAGKTTFQVLSGKWSLRAGALDLGPDSPPAKAFAAPDRLKLESEGGSVVFHRGKTE